jgi:hypothetical protein
MGARLDGVRFKIERAKRHLIDLDLEVEKFLATHPLRIDTNEIDPETGDTLAKVVVKRQPPPILGLIVGDLVHNLRTALDYAAWQLVDCNDGRPGRHTQYPISMTQDDFEDNGRARLRGAAEAAIRAVSLHQPFRIATPRMHPLAVLSALDNRDKHRLLHVVGGVIMRMGIGPGPSGDLFLHHFIFVPPRDFLRHGDVVARARGDAGVLRLTTQFGVGLNTRDQPLRETLMPLFAGVEQAIVEVAKYVS